MPEFTVTRFLAGYYRVTAEDGFANIKRSRDGKHEGKWVGDVRNKNGALVQYTGVWETKKEAIEEAQKILKASLNS